MVEAEVTKIPPEDDINQALPTLETRTLDFDQLKLKNQELREKIADMISDRRLRQKYATWAFGYLVFFTGFCVIVVIAQGRPDVAFKLNDQVVITLVGSTAVAAIGLVGWIAKGLFKAPNGS